MFKKISTWANKFDKGHASLFVLLKARLLLNHKDFDKRGNILKLFVISLLQIYENVNACYFQYLSNIC